jgi:antitoxin component YwqK of YwqJK toxin-antitoxin module
MESNNSKQRPMKQYLEWLEKQIDFCLEDGTMQKEHWAFCKAYEKFKSLETTAESEELTLYTEYYDNGNVRVKGQKNSKGQKEGIWECFYESRNIHWRIPYKGGKIDGIEEYFHDNGNIQSRIPYKEGKIDGIVEGFYYYGNIHCRTPFKEGKEDGIEEVFYDNGNITKTRLWKDGKLIEETKH